MRKRPLNTVLVERGSSGFTLIELLIVISIIGILATIAVPVYLGQRTKAQQKEAMTNLEAIRLLQEQYFAENSAYAPDAGNCDFNKPANIASIQAVLPGFKPGRGEQLFFSYCMENDTDFDGNPTADPCFRARAYGNSGQAVEGMVLSVDCNNVKNY